MFSKRLNLRSEKQFSGGFIVNSVVESHQRRWDESGSRRLEKVVQTMSPNHSTDVDVAGGYWEQRDDQNSQQQTSVNTKSKNCRID